MYNKYIQFNVNGGTTYIILYFYINEKLLITMFDICMKRVKNNKEQKYQTNCATML